MATEKQIAEGINMLKVAFPNYQPDVKATAQLWMVALSDLPGETLQAAIMACVTERGRAFAPSVGEIRDAAVRLGAQSAGIPSALEAYNEVAHMPGDMTGSRIVEEGGQTYIEKWDLHFSHEFVERVARLIGWPQTFPTDEPGVDRAQFNRFYDAELSRYLDHAAQPPALLEYIEAGGDAARQIATVAKQKQLKG